MQDFTAFLNFICISGGAAGAFFVLFAAVFRQSADG
jgi:hypothetical protein